MSERRRGSRIPIKAAVTAVIAVLVCVAALVGPRPARSAQPKPAGCPDAHEYVDPTYGGRVRQLKKRDGHAHNIYYHRNPWNADNSYMIGIQSDSEQRNWAVVLYDGQGCFLKRLFGTEQYDWRLVWDRHDPKTLYSWKGSNLYRYDVTRERAELLKSFAPARIGVSGPSLNEAGDRILVLTSDGAFRSYSLPHMQDERTFAVRFPAGCVSDFEDERYIGFRNYVATHCRTADLTTQHAFVYEDTGQLVTRFDGMTFEHADFGPGGRVAYTKMPRGPRGAPRPPLEVRVVNLDGTHDRALYSVPAAQAAFVQNLHVSWPDRVADWFVVSFFPSARNLPSAYAPPLDEIAIVNVASGKVTFLCRTGTAIVTRQAGFWAQTLASPSGDGSRIAFNSNRSGVIEAHILWTAGRGGS